MAQFRQRPPVTTTTTVTRRSARVQNLYIFKKKNENFCSHLNYYWSLEKNSKKTPLPLTHALWKKTPPWSVIIENIENKAFMTS